MPFVENRMGSFYIEKGIERVSSAIQNYKRNLVEYAL